MRLADTPLSWRAFSRLDQLGIETVEQLAAKSREELHALPGFGPTCLREVEELLASGGLELKPPLPDPRQERIEAMRDRGLSLSRIAAAEGITKQAVWTRLQCPMRKFRRLIAGDTRGEER